MRPGTTVLRTINLFFLISGLFNILPFVVSSIFSQYIYSTVNISFLVSDDVTE